MCLPRNCTERPEWRPTIDPTDLRLSAEDQWRSPELHLTHLPRNMPLPRCEDFEDVQTCEDRDPPACAWTEDYGCVLHPQLRCADWWLRDNDDWDAGDQERCPSRWCAAGRACTAALESQTARYNFWDDWFVGALNWTGGPGADAGRWVYEERSTSGDEEPEECPEQVELEDTPPTHAGVVHNTTETCEGTPWHYWRNHWFSGITEATGGRTPDGLTDLTYGLFYPSYKAFRTGAASCVNITSTECDYALAFAYACDLGEGCVAANCTVRAEWSSPAGSVRLSQRLDPSAADSRCEDIITEGGCRAEAHCAWDATELLCSLQPELLCSDTWQARSPAYDDVYDRPESERCPSAFCLPGAHCILDHLSDRYGAAPSGGPEEEEDDYAYFGTDTDPGFVTREEEDPIPADSQTYYTYFWTDSNSAPVQAAPVSTTDASSDSDVRAVVDLRGETPTAELAEGFKAGLAAAITAAEPDGDGDGDDAAVSASNVTIVSMDAITTRRRSLLGVAGTRIVAEVATASPAAASAVSGSLEASVSSGGLATSLADAGLTNVTAVGVRSLKVGSVSVADETTAASMFTANGTSVGYSPDATVMTDANDAFSALLAAIFGDALRSATRRDGEEDNDAIIIVAVCAGGGSLLLIAIVYFCCCIPATKRVGVSGKSGGGAPAGAAVARPAPSAPAMARP